MQDITSGVGSINRKYYRGTNKYIYIFPYKFVTFVFVYKSTFNKVRCDFLL